MKTKTAVRRMRQMLLDFQQWRYHEPDSDAMEYCAGCNQSPYYTPPHLEGCRVVRLAALLQATARLDD